MDYLWRLGLGNRTELINKSHRSYMTDRQRLTWQQTFFKRVISLCTASWFFSLESEQWWRERSADGVVIDIQFIRVQGPAVAGGLLDEEFSGLWNVVVVKFVGLITCERAVSTKVSDCSSFAGVHRVFLLEPTHMEVQGKDQENEVEDERDSEECRVEEYQKTTTTPCRWHMRWHARNTLNLSQWHWKSVVKHRQNVTCVFCSHFLNVSWCVLGCSRLCNCRVFHGFWRCLLKSFQHVWDRCGFFQVVLCCLLGGFLIFQCSCRLRCDSH